jgi:hypothetical protein
MKARVGDEAIRAALMRHPMPPTHGACPRCGASRFCPSCYVRHGRALFRAIGLTDQEQAQCQALLEQCRALDLASLNSARNHIAE